MLEVYKWKLSFDGYRDKLPQYFNDYINSYLKFLQMDQALLLPSFERLLFDQNRMLASLVKDLRQKQHQTDNKHEQVFKDMKELHAQDCFFMPKCCSNIKKKTISSIIKDPHQMAFKGDAQGPTDSAMPVAKHLNRINSFTLTGNSSLHFELSRDPTELIGAIFW